MSESGLDNLRGVLAELDAFELPVLAPDSFRTGSALLSDIPVKATPESLYEVLDAFVTILFPARFDPPAVFQWAGGPGEGREIREFPDEDDFDTAEAFEEAADEYWEHFGKPEPWQEITDPIRDWLLETVQWSINNKLYRIQRAFEREDRIHYATDPKDQPAIDEQEAEHQRQRRRLIDLFCSAIGESARFFRTCHVMDEQSAEDRRWELHRDKIYAVIDDRHVRVLWVLHDRLYG